MLNLRLPTLCGPPISPELTLDLPIGTGKKLWIATHRAVLGLAATHRMRRGFAMIRSGGGSHQRPHLAVNGEHKHAAWRIAVEALLIELMLRSACSQTDPAYELVSLGVLALDNIGDGESEPILPQEKREVVRIITDLTRRAREMMS